MYMSQFHVANNEGHEGSESLQRAEFNYFFLFREILLAMRSYGNLQVNCTGKRWRPQVREKWDAVNFHFCFHSQNFPEKKKETGV